MPFHHELPKLYLRGFCEIDSSFLWVFQRSKPFKPGLHSEKNNPYKRGINKAALRKDMYAIRVPGQSLDFSYEEKLQQEEKKADIAIHKIRNQKHFDRSDKQIMTRYIGLMRKRLASRDHSIIPIIENKIKTHPWERRQREFAYNGRFDAALWIPKIQESLELESGINMFLRESMLKSIGMVHQVLTSMVWSFQLAPTGAYFVTSDKPIVFDEHLGLLRSSLFFPISQHVTLVAHRVQDGDLAYKKITSEEVRKINSLIIKSATKEIFSPKPDIWIHQGMEYGFTWT